MADFDISALNLDDSPIEGIEEAFQNWSEPQEFPPPPPPGKKSAVVASIRDMKQLNGNLSVNLDMTLKGGADDGKPLNFVRLSGKMFERGGVRTSQLLDFVKSSGAQQVPNSNLQFAQYLKRMVDAGTLVYFQVDWRAYCTNCANTALMDETGEQTDAAAAAALEELRRSDGRRAAEIQKKVRAAGEQFKHYRTFPEMPGGVKGADGVVPRKDIVNCPKCGQELRAQANITRWLKAPVEPYQSASMAQAPAQDIPF